MTTTKPRTRSISITWRRKRSWNFFRRSTKVTLICVRRNDSIYPRSYIFQTVHRCNEITTFRIHRFSQGRFPYAHAIRHKFFTEMHGSPCRPYDQVPKSLLLDPDGQFPRTPRFPPLSWCIRTTEDRTHQT